MHLIFTGVRFLTGHHTTLSNTPRANSIATYSKFVDVSGANNVLCVTSTVCSEAGTSN
jgi:hypothetical protein